MTKQEKIREGIERLIRKWEGDSPDAGYGGVVIKLNTPIEIGLEGLEDYQFGLSFIFSPFILLVILLLELRRALR